MKETKTQNNWGMKNQFIPSLVHFLGLKKDTLELQFGFTIWKEKHEIFLFLCMSSMTCCMKSLILWARNCEAGNSYFLFPFAPNGTISNFLQTRGSQWDHALNEIHNYLTFLWWIRKTCPEIAQDLWTKSKI